MLNKIKNKLNNINIIFKANAESLTNKLSFPSLKPVTNVVSPTSTSNQKSDEKKPIPSILKNKTELGSSKPSPPSPQKEGNVQFNNVVKVVAFNPESETKLKVKLKHQELSPPHNRKNSPLSPQLPPNRLSPNLLTLSNIQLNLPNSNGADGDRKALGRKKQSIANLRAEFKK